MFRTQDLQPLAVGLLRRVVELAEQIDEIVLCWIRASVRRLTFESVEATLHVPVEIFHGELVATGDAVDLLLVALSFVHVVVGYRVRLSLPNELFELLLFTAATDLFEFSFVDLRPVRKRRLVSFLLLLVLLLLLRLPVLVWVLIF